MVGFIRGEMQRRVQDGFSILLPAEDALQVFVEKLKISCITAVTQAYIQQWLILNLSAQTNRVMPSVKNTTEGDLPGVNAVWSGIPAHPPGNMGGISSGGLSPGFKNWRDGCVHHYSTHCPSEVGAFTYVIPSAPYDNNIIICIDLVLLMGWVDPPKFFCALLETLTDVVNTLVDTRAAWISMHPINGRVHPGGDAAEGPGWI